MKIIVIDLLLHFKYIFIFLLTHKNNKHCKNIHVLSFISQIKCYIEHCKINQVFGFYFSKKCQNLVTGTLSQMSGTDLLVPDILSGRVKKIIFRLDFTLKHAAIMSYQFDLRDSMRPKGCRY